jgi:glycerophosphoryl diester phosphodiesterase
MNQASTTGNSDWSRLWKDFCARWRLFLLIHILVAALVSILLAPATTALLRLAVRLSGDVALSDQDILFFVLTPMGFLSFLVLASLFGIILFLEYAALMVAARSLEDGKPAGASQVFRRLLHSAPRLFHLAVLILGRVLLTLAPYLAALGLIFYLFLTEYDINYYLAMKPSAWNQALGLGAVVGGLLAIHLVRLFTGLVFTLPLVLGGAGAKAAIGASRQAARGWRLSIARRFLAWLVFSFLLAAAGSLLVAVAGYLLVPQAPGSVKTLLVLMTLLSLAGLAVSFLVTFISSAMLSLLILHMSDERGLGGRASERTFEPDESGRLNIPAFRLIVAGLLGALLVSLFLADRFIEGLQFENPPVVMAHRGASAAAPENTMAAIRGAIESGADWVEIDVQETADGEVVVIHDRDLKKISGVALEVAGSTLEELRQVDIGSWFAPEFQDQRIPTLRDVLELCRDRIKVNIELKYYGKQVMLEQRVADLVDSMDMADQVAVMSLSLDGIREMKRLRPGWSVGLLSTVALGELAKLDIDFLALNARAATPSLLRHAGDQGKKVLVWTVNDAVGMASMAGRGVDGIITDEPALAVSLLRQVSELGPAERILLRMADVFHRPGLIAEQ